MADATPEPRVSDADWATHIVVTKKQWAEVHAAIASQAEALAAMTAERDALAKGQNTAVEAMMQAQRARRAAEAALKAARETLQEVDGCFEAALAEGWADALASGDIERITDLFNRRIVCARTAAVAALTKES